MLRRILVVLVVLSTAIIVERVHAAASSPDATSAFACIWCDNGPTNFCFRDEHDDFLFSFVKNYQDGQVHNCGNGTCDQYHWPYQIVEGARGLSIEARNALASGRDAEILRILEEHSEVQLNVERNAVQVVAQNGDVWLHAPLANGQGVRLARALAN